MKRGRVGAVFVAGIGLGSWFTWWGHSPSRMVYTTEGYGGVRVADHSEAGRRQRDESARAAGAIDPVAPALRAYNEGRYADAERAARRLVEAETKRSSREGARAHWVLAFSAARRHDLVTARERFGQLRQVAAGQSWTLETPRQAGVGGRESRAGGETAGAAIGKRPASHSNSERETRNAEPPPERPVSPTGEALPTLEEEAAYQHAVLTAALARGARRPGTSSDPEDAKPGTRNPEPGTAAAEAEFVEFIRQYPESPLVHAAVRRIARLHGGNVPPDVEAVWKRAMAVAQQRQQQRDRSRSLCGPEVLREVLRRTGVRSEEPADGDGREAGAVEALARELGTDHQGTTLAALAKAAEVRGLRAKGLKLTWNGLWRITNGPDGKRDAPEFLIALVQPGHYVLVEDVRAGEVDVWDPSGQGPDQPGARRYSRAEWLRLWGGSVLRLDGPGVTAGASPAR